MSNQEKIESTSIKKLEFRRAFDKIVIEIREEFPGEYCQEEEQKKEIANRFFKLWFIKYGEPLFFLFKRNLKVTNIQFAELLALLRSYNKEYFSEGTGNTINNLIFMSVAEFREMVCDSLEAILNFQEATRQNWRSRIEEIYGSLLRRIVIIDSFYGSCAVFIPPHLEIKLKEICFASGYIHSCGKNVFIRKINKTSKKQFFEAIDAHIKNNNNNDKMFFTVYSHEDYTKYDRDKESILRSGLDEVKIYIDKFWMGQERLVSVIRQMKKEFKDKLLIPEPGNYKETYLKLVEENGLEEEIKKTLWLIVDHAIDINNYYHPGEERYYICYEQQYVNENIFHIFDEEKPGWIADITMPHSLTGAMINITQPFWDTSNNKTVRLADPFGGTATTWFEALKFPEVECVCSDKGEESNEYNTSNNSENTNSDNNESKLFLNAILAKDNLKILSFTKNELQDLCKNIIFLQEILEHYINSNNEIDSKEMADYLLINNRNFLENLELKDIEKEKKKYDEVYKILSSFQPTEKLNNYLQLGAKNNNLNENEELKKKVSTLIRIWRLAFTEVYFKLIPEKEHKRYGSKCEWTKEIIERLEDPIKIVKDSTDENEFKIEKSIHAQSAGEFVFFETEEEKLFYRVLFYISLRTIIRRAVILEKQKGEPLLKANTQELTGENREQWRKLYLREQRILLSRLEELLKIREREEKIQPREANNDEKCVSFIDSYSYATTINSVFLREKLENLEESSAIIKRDATKLFEEIEKGTDKSYHVIITDPPYGLNIKEGIEDLADLFTKALISVIKSLEDGGQLVLGLPERSHTGRPLPFFTQKDFIAKQIIAIAEDANLEVIDSFTTVPQPREIFQAPYYWESERALRRAVLHFRFRKKLQP